ncbi:MAG: RDD family protein [Chthoniobacter sp.]|nr:RDD family protein [Chthoniobacter sp.]
MILYVGFLMCLWTKRKQCLHDIMAGCLVSTRPTVSPLPDFKNQTGGRATGNSPVLIGGVLVAAAILLWLIGPAGKLVPPASSGIGRAAQAKTQSRPAAPGIPAAVKLPKIQQGWHTRSRGTNVLDSAKGTATRAAE